jgi:2-C-methyl-D-erythritol 2,4-cyclodiphosphate synthase
VRIGHGYDAHRLVAGRPLRLGGVEVPHPRGLEGHSDGDVLLHAIASALLGALGEGDLGRHFPSSDPSLAGIASGELLSRVAVRMRAAGLRLAHLDSTIVAQEPRLAGFLERMRDGIAAVLETGAERVNEKVTTPDRLGAIGRGEAIAAHAEVLLEGAR